MDKKNFTVCGMPYEEYQKFKHQMLFNKLKERHIVHQVKLATGFDGEFK